MPQTDLWDIQHIVDKLKVGKTEVYGFGTFYRCFSMSDFDFKDGSQRGSDNNAGEMSEEMLAEQDLLMEEIINNLNNTPVGQVLKKLAALPEVRRQKVLNVRQQLTSGNYDLGERLDVVLDKVIEELTA